MRTSLLLFTLFICVAGFLASPLYALTRPTSGLVPSPATTTTITTQNTLTVTAYTEPSSLAQSKPAPVPAKINPTNGHIEGVVTAPSASAPTPDSPARLSIPSISLNDRIISVGLTKDGAMDVPSGKTSDVGWYKAGTFPGNIGNSVIDAHVFAAFKRLHEVKAGDSIFVKTKENKTLHFVVTNAITYPLAEVPTDLLFGPTNEAHLNLITCAGSLTPDHTTYDHRLVVYATLVD